MELVSQEEAEAIFAEAREFFSGHDMFRSVGAVAILAAVEFAVSREGKTLYPYKADS